MLFRLLAQNMTEAELEIAAEKPVNSYLVELANSGKQQAMGEPVKVVDDFSSKLSARLVRDLWICIILGLRVS